MLQVVGLLQPGAVSVQVANNPKRNSTAQQQQQGNAQPDAPPPVVTFETQLVHVEQPVTADALVVIESRPVVHADGSIPSVQAYARQEAVCSAQ